MKKKLIKVIKNDIQLYHEKRRDGKRGEWLHRVDGPAVIYNADHFMYFVEGKQLTKKQFDKHPLVKAFKSVNKNSKESVNNLTQI